VGIDKDTWRRRDAYTDVGDSDTRHWHYEVATLGYKYNMNDLAAAIGRVQLRRLDAMNERRRELIRHYLDDLRGVQDIAPLLPYDPASGAYWLFGIRTGQREHLIRELKRWRIATGVHYMPMGLHPIFARFNHDLPVSNSVWEQLLTLPLHSELTHDEVDRVTSTVKSALE
jgi:perosamine synthetase